MRRPNSKLAIGTALLGLSLIASAPAWADATILNVSYDPTRELYQEFNPLFAEHWKEQTGEAVTIQKSHGGSGKQARAVIDGLEADVVTLALAYDIDAIAEHGEAAADRTGRAACRTTARPTPRPSSSWSARATPRASSDWDDLVKPGVAGDHAQPEDLGRRALELPGRLGLRAAPARAATRPRRSDFVDAPLPATCRCSTPARAARRPPSSQRGIGDVLLAWENEAFLAVKELGADKFEIVVPSVSILAEPPVAVVDKVVDKHGTRAVAAGLPGVPLLAGGPGDRRQALLSARATPKVAAEVRRRSFPQVDAVHHRRGVRRLAEGAGHALRRRRRVRPDLPAGQ